MNDIIEILGLEDENIFVSNVTIDGTNKVITLETKVQNHICPICGFKMYSKGVKSRTIRHSVLQNGYGLIINLKQRRWKCTNNNCKYDIQEKFNFVDKRRRVTNLTEFLVVMAFKNIEKTAEDIGKEFNITGHAAMNIFTKYVHPKRNKLPEVLSVDEVYLNMDSRCKYVLVLQDFKTGEPVDLLISRRQEYTLPYFSNISINERCNVKFLISDMYNPYIEYTTQYFPNAISIVDSFHVMQWIIHKLDLYIIKLAKKYKERDIERYKNKLKPSQRMENIPISDEVYLLSKHKWVILKNQDNIDYKSETKYNNHFKINMDVYTIESKFLAIDPNFEILRHLKERYVTFNTTPYDDLDKVNEELEDLIMIYSTSGQNIFMEFAKLLVKYKEPIINSFRYFEKINTDGTHVVTRLSNGPIESLNRKAKDLKRNGRGYTNFENLRSRFLFSTRKTLPFSDK